jgi:hypothetical protein
MDEKVDINVCIVWMISCMLNENLKKKLHPMNERYPFAPSGSFKT